MNHYEFFVHVVCRFLSAEGVARCEAACQERNLKVAAKNVEKVALDVSVPDVHSVCNMFMNQHCDFCLFFQAGPSVHWKAGDRKPRWKSKEPGLYRRACALVINLNAVIDIPIVHLYDICYKLYLLKDPNFLHTIISFCDV